MSALDQTLATIRERISQHQGRGISEEATKTALVNPLLRALGWDTEDLHQVYPEYSSVRGRVDYALLIEDRPRLLIEAKALEANLDDPKSAEQLTGYAFRTGVRWAVLTNGDEYRVYNAYAEVPIPEKLFNTVCVSDQDSRAGETLGLLSHGAVRDNRLDACWQEELENRRLERVNQQLQSTLQALIDQDPPNQSLVRLLRNQPGCQLAPGDIREGLRRTRVRFELPENPPDPPTPPIGPVDPPRPRPRGSRVLLGHLIEAEILKPPIDIHMIRKRRRFTAHIEADGTIVFQGNRYKTPSAAGSAIRVLLGDRPEVNGWEVWQFTEADGRNQPLSVLRDRYLERRAPEQP